MTSPTASGLLGHTAIRNAGGLVTGDLARPFDEVDTVLIRDGLVHALGEGLDFDTSDYQVVIDARGNIVAPGLIDSHVHLVFGDWTPRQNTLGFLESYAHGGLTEVLSASEVHLPGRPTDPLGVKSLALVAHRSFGNLRPAGMKVHGGSVILEPGLTEQDFQELASEGVWLAKAGFGSFTSSAELAQVVRAAQNQGFKVMCHSGGLSIPGSSAITARDLLTIMPDVAAHINGGTTSLPDDDLADIVESGIALQICQAGNLRSALKILELASERSALDRVLVASDTPSGTGVMPLAMIKSVAELCSLGSIPPAVALAFGSGNVGRIYGLRSGFVRVGAPADVILLDAPAGSQASNALEALVLGDLPSITAVIVDGSLRVHPSRNTPMAARPPAVERIR